MSTPDITADTSLVLPTKLKRPRRRLLAFVLLPVLFALVGAAYAWRSRLLPLAAAREHSVPDKPKLNAIPGSDPAHPRYQTSYLKIEGAFTTNLRNSPRFVQVELGVATDYDPIVLARVQTHEIPIRSAVLAILAQQDETVITSSGGRSALEAELTRAVNRVLAEREGFGGIDHVYLTGLVIQ
jgi:flagellar basal body-associated protein FliL